jgi:hypothetical protein
MQGAPFLCCRLLPDNVVLFRVCLFRLHLFVSLLCGQKVTAVQNERRSTLSSPFYLLLLLLLFSLSPSSPSHLPPDNFAPS